MASPTSSPHPSHYRSILHEEQAIQWTQKIERVDGHKYFTRIVINGEVYKITYEDPSKVLSREDAMRAISQQIDTMAILGVRYLGGDTQRVHWNPVDQTIKREYKVVKAGKYKDLHREQHIGSFQKFDRKLDEDRRKHEAKVQTETTEDRQRKRGERIGRIVVASELFTIYRDAKRQPPRGNVPLEIELEEERSVPRQVHSQRRRHDTSSAAAAAAAAAASPEVPASYSSSSAAAAAAAAIPPFPHPSPPPSLSSDALPRPPIPPAPVPQPAQTQPPQRRAPADAARTLTSKRPPAAAPASSSPPPSTAPANPARDALKKLIDS